MPVLMVATYNADGSVDVMNAAWGTMVEPDIVALNLTASHKTVKNILERKAFTVAFADAAHVAECDYLGIVSGNNFPDKFAKTGLTATKSDKVDAPIINELPVSMECEFIEYQDGAYGLGVIGKIVGTVADEKIVKSGKVDVEKMQAIAFDTYTLGYYKVTERVGEAFREGKKLK
ncbi:MAG: flavin reductase [Clostridia bacterium]|nr:flavin reductase [Clostridia bacterium]